MSKRISLSNSEPPLFLHPARRCRSSVVEHSLGKGEVVSSILTGSTRYSRDECIFDFPTSARYFDTERSMKATFDSCEIRAV